MRKKITYIDEITIHEIWTAEIDTDETDEKILTELIAEGEIELYNEKYFSSYNKSSRIIDAKIEDHHPAKWHDNAKEVIITLKEN